MTKAQSPPPPLSPVTSIVTLRFLCSISRHLFTQLSLWVNWFMVVIIISAVLTSYCLLLLVRRGEEGGRVGQSLRTWPDINTCLRHAALCTLPCSPSRAAPLTLAAQGSPPDKGVIRSGVQIWRLSICFDLNTGPLMFGRDLCCFGGHGHQLQVARRITDCSSVAAGRLSLRNSLFVRC